MPWTFVECPKQKTKIPLHECLQCTDKTAHFSCPLYYDRIRIISDDRGYLPNVYYISELKGGLRQSFLKRFVNYTDKWDWITDRSCGSAIHSQLSNVFLIKELHIQKSFGDFSVVGRVDAIDVLNGILWEFKTWASLTQMLFTENERGDVKPKYMDLWQLAAYYEIIQQDEALMLKLPTPIFKFGIYYEGRAKSRWVKWRRGKLMFPPFTTEELNKQYSWLPTLTEQALKYHDYVKKQQLPPKETCRSWEPDDKNPFWMCERCPPEIKKACKNEAV